MKIQKEVIDKNLCISCGLCAQNGYAEMSMKKGIYLPKFKRKIEPAEDEFLYKICPGKGYNIIDTGKDLYSKDNSYNYKLGYYSSIGAAYTNDQAFLKKSSSGGMMPFLAYYLLKEKIVQGVLTVKFDYTKNGPVPKPFIAKTKEDLISAQGSKYMPVPLLQNIDEVIKFPGKLAVIGTPCQIAGLRLLQQENKKLNEKIKFTIANFCGGYRDFRETERIFKIFNVKKEKIKEFSYRGNGQPGTMTIQQKNAKPIQISYPDYARLTGYTKYYRCRLCVDATGELADVSFGDAWHPRFIDSGKKWSFYICRSKEMEAILNEIKEKSGANFELISVEELVISQKGNLTTKKERQNSRLKLYQLMNMYVPHFDGGFNKHATNLKLELKVLVSHKLFYLLERTRLYLPLAKILKRVNKTYYEV